MGILAHSAAGPDDAPNSLLKRLSSSQIFMICIGGTVGIGFAKSSGEIIGIAGPGGALISFIVVGIVAICVMEGVCEMINLWPISNGMIEFVRSFVDPDLAIVVGFTYWYAYCCALAALIIGAGSILTYFNVNPVLLNVLYAVSLLGIFLINCCGVLWFGIIEFWGGVLKLMLLAGIFILMMCINGGVNTGQQIGSTPFTDGVRNNPFVASSHGVAILIAIPLSVFPYIGIELVTITAFEAANPANLRWTTKNIAYVILLIYGITIGGIVANVEWFDQNLPQNYSQDLVYPKITDINILGHKPIANQDRAAGTSFAPVIAVLEAGASYKPVASILLGFLVYSALSCANANLYVASRTLYGIARDLDFNSDNFFESFFAHLNIVTPAWRVPLWSVIASIVLVATWLPFVKLGLNQQDLYRVMSSVGSVGVLLVWACQCLAFIRYHRWLWIHRLELNGDHERFQRWPLKSNNFSSYFAAIQPVPAYLGLICCLVIVFIFNSAEMWNGNQVLLKGLNVYLGPAISLLLFVILKIINRRGWVELGSWRKLHTTLDRLDSLVMHSTSAENSAFVPVASSPTAKGPTMELAHLSDFSGIRPGHSSFGSVGIPPPQDPLYPQPRQDQPSVPPTEMGVTGNEPTWVPQAQSPVSFEDRTPQYPPQTQNFQYYPPNQHQYSQQNYQG